MINDKLKIYINCQRVSNSISDVKRTVISKDEIMGLIIDLETKSLEEIYEIYFGGRY